MIFYLLPFVFTAPDQSLDKFARTGYSMTELSA
jgi:hypothetical protein